MGVGAPGLGGGPAQPPDIHQTETQAFVEGTKKFVLSMMPGDTLEVVPFTQRESDEVFKYRAEPDRPTLHPLLFLRLSEAGLYEVQEETWQPIYNDLLETFPEEVQEWLAWEMNLPFADRDPSFVALHNLLTTTAKAIAWLSVVTRPIQGNTAAEQDYLQNVALPYVAARSIISQTETILAAGRNWLDSLGPNYPHYDIVNNYLTHVSDAVSRFNELRMALEAGSDSAEIRQQLMEMSDEIDRLNTLYQATSTGGDLHILGVYLNALSSVSAAWAVAEGTPSLLIGISSATIGLSENESAAGIQGNGYSTVVDSLLEGIINSVIFGPRAELEELGSLYNSLNELRSE